MEQANRTPGSRSWLQCDKCLNRGMFVALDEEGRRIYRPCSCVERYKSMKNLEKSGLSDLASRYTMENWRSDEPWQSTALDMVKCWLSLEKKPWLFLSGPPGTGKTHLCTILCTQMIQQGWDTRYMLWRDHSVRAKAAVNDGEAYQRLVDPLKTVKLLYVDDLFKSGRGLPPTQGDLNLAFELINYRYNSTGLPTIFSSESSLGDLMKVDDAIASRIAEKCQDFFMDFAQRPNQRLRTAP